MKKLLALLLKRRDIVSNNDAIITAAPLGYAVLHFAPGLAAKPSMSVLTELVREQTLPVLCFRTQGNKSEPLTFRTPPANALCFLQVGQRYYDLASDRSWPNWDMFAQHLLGAWRQSKNLMPTKSPRQPGRTEYTIPADGKGTFTIPTSSPLGA